MAVTQRLQDATGVIATDSLGNAIIAITEDGVTPTGSGYSKGCLLIDQSGSGSPKKNTGDADTATWAAV